MWEVKVQVTTISHEKKMTRERKKDQGIRRRSKKKEEETDNNKPEEGNIDPNNMKNMSVERSSR